VKRIVIGGGWNLITEYDTAALRGNEMNIAVQSGNISVFFNVIAIVSILASYFV